MFYHCGNHKAKALNVRLKHYLFLQMRKQIRAMLKNLPQIIELVRSKVGIQIQVSLSGYKFVWYLRKKHLENVCISVIIFL